MCQRELLRLWPQGVQPGRQSRDQIWEKFTNMIFWLLPADQDGDKKGCEEESRVHGAQNWLIFVWSFFIHNTWADLGACSTFSRGLNWEQGCLNTLMTNDKQQSIGDKQLRIMVLTGREAMTPQHTLKTARVATIKISCTSMFSA